MRQLLRLLVLPVLVGGLVLAAPVHFSGAQDKQDKKDDGKKSASEPDPKTKLKGKTKADWGLYLPGKITVLDDKDDKGLTFTIQVLRKIPEWNTGAQQTYVQQQQQLAQQQVTLAKAKTAQDRQNALNSINQTLIALAKTEATLIQYKDANFDVKCTALEKIRVRHFQPQQAIDTETGEFIKLTKQQLEEARGPEGYPGYRAESKILKVGQTVQVFFSKDTKTPASLLEKKGGKDAPKKIDDLQDEINNFRYDVIMIVVVADAPKAKG
jgi:hypothetical protein